MTSTLKDELFNELLESVREGGAILQGKTAPSRIFVKDVSLAPLSVIRPKKKKAKSLIDKKSNPPLHATV